MTIAQPDLAPLAAVEVTAQNAAAIRLYRRVGFTAIKTVYKAVEAAYAK